MKDLATLLARSEAYEQRHAEWITAGHALQAERDGLIALGKSLGFFAGRLQAELPKVPNLKVPEEAPPSGPDLLTGISQPGGDALAEAGRHLALLSSAAQQHITERVAEINHLFEEGAPTRSSVQPDEKPCADMTDDEICLGHVDIIRRWGAWVQGQPLTDTELDWLRARIGAFEVQLEARGMTPRILGAMSYRLNISGNSKPYAAGTAEANEWSAGWLDEQAKGAKPVTTTEERAA